MSYTKYLYNSQNEGANIKIFAFEVTYMLFGAYIIDKDFCFSILDVKMIEIGC